MNREQTHLAYWLLGISFVSVLLLSIFSIPSILVEKDETIFQTSFLDRRTAQVKIAQASMDISLSAKDASTKIDISRPDSAISFETTMPNPQLKVADTTAKFVSDDAGIEVEYTVLANGLKEDIILNSKPSSNIFSSRVQASQVIPYITHDQFIVFYNKLGEYQFHFEKPYAIDDAGIKTYSVSYIVLDENQKNEIEVPELPVNETYFGRFPKQLSAKMIASGEHLWSSSLSQNYVLQVVVNPEWLFAPERAYPLIIDPTVVYDTTVTGTMTGFQSSVTSASITGTTDHLYLASIGARYNYAVTSVTGLGLTWNLVRAQCSARGISRTEVWYAIGNPSPSGTVTANFASNPTQAAIAVSKFSNVDVADPIGAVVSMNNLGVDSVTCTGGTDINTYTVNVTTTVDNAMVFGAASIRQYTHTPGAGYTERAEFNSSTGGDAAGLALQEQQVASPTTLAYNGSTSQNNDSAVVVVEIKPYVNQAPNTPTLGTPADTAATVSLTPTLTTTTTDPEADYLRYRIQLCEDSGMSVGCQTFDQTLSQTGWSGQDAETSTAYASGSTASYTVQVDLAETTTYYWTTQAIDPAGTNTWSSVQGTPYSFTTLTVDVNDPPDAPTTLRVNGAVNPTNLLVLTPQFTAVYTDLDLADEADAYQIQVSTVSDFSSTFADFTGALSPVVAQGNQSQSIAYSGPSLGFAGQTYYWRIRFTDVGNEVGAWSTETATFSMTTVAQSGQCTARLTNDATAIVLFWSDDSLVETSYEIERSVNSAAFAALSTEAADTVTYNDTGISLGSTYKYRIRAVVGLDYGQWCVTGLLTPQVGNTHFEGFLIF